MARLIDADALKGVFVGEYPGMYTKKYIKNLIDGMPTVGGWISVEDRLPEDTHAYIICILVGDGARCVTTGKYDWRYDMWSDEIGRIWVPDRVTHWMLLPEPPEEVNGDE